MDASALSSAEYWLAWIGTAKLIAAFLVAAGVAIEFGGDWISRPFERTVAEARRLEIVGLQNDTASLSREAEILRAQNLQLEARVAPRRLTGAQQAALVTALSSLSGRRVRVKSYSLDAESAILAEQLIDCFKSAGLEVDKNILSQGALGVVATGVWVSGSIGELHDVVANRILEALESETNLASKFGAVQPGGGLYQPDDGTVVDATVFVGVKPVTE